jgi:hypothetical protein
MQTNAPRGIEIPQGGVPRRGVALSVGDFQRLLTLPGYASLEQSLVHELAEYTQVTPSALLERIEKSTQTLASEWRSADRTSTEAEKAFYVGNEEYLFELTRYNSST